MYPRNHGNEAKQPEVGLGDPVLDIPSLLGYVMVVWLISALIQLANNTFQSS